MGKQNETFEGGRPGSSGVVRGRPDEGSRGSSRRGSPPVGGCPLGRPLQVAGTEAGDGSNRDDPPQVLAKGACPICDGDVTIARSPIAPDSEDEDRYMAYLENECSWWAWEGDPGSCLACGAQLTVKVDEDNAWLEPTDDPPGLECEGCGRRLPELTAEELAELPELMPAVCDECLGGDRVHMQRLPHGGGWPVRLAGGGTMDRDYYRSELLQASREMARVALRLEAATELARLVLELEEMKTIRQRTMLQPIPKGRLGQMYDLARQLTQPEPESDR